MFAATNTYGHPRDSVLVGNTAVGFLTRSIVEEHTHTHTRVYLAI